MSVEPKYGAYSQDDLADFDYAVKRTRDERYWWGLGLAAGVLICIVGQPIGVLLILGCGLKCMDLGNDIKIIEDLRFRHLHGYRRGESSEPKYFDGHLVESRGERYRRRVVKDTGWELTDTSVIQQVTKPKRKSASQSKTPANSDPAPIREILKNHGHKLIVRNNKYFIYVDDEKYEFETESQVFRFLKTQGFI